MAMTSIRSDSMILLEKYRKENGLSVRQLSIKSGVSRTYITAIEEGVHDNPGVKIICALCRALKTTPNDLIEKEYWSE